MLVALLIYIINILACLVSVVVDIMFAIRGYSDFLLRVFYGVATLTGVSSLLLNLALTGLIIWKLWQADRSLAATGQTRPVVYRRVIKALIESGAGYSITLLTIMISSYLPNVSPARSRMSQHRLNQVFKVASPALLYIGPVMFGIWSTLLVVVSGIHVGENILLYSSPGRSL